MSLVIVCRTNYRNVPDNDPISPWSLACRWYAEVDLLWLNTQNRKQRDWPIVKDQYWWEKFDAQRPGWVIAEDYQVAASCLQDQPDFQKRPMFFWTVLANKLFDPV